MRVTIIAADNAVIVNGKGGKADCSDILKQGISVVQWYDSVGEIEYVGHAQPNEEIYNLGPYQGVIDSVKFPEPSPPPPKPQPPLVVTTPSPTPIEKLLFDMENRILALEGKPSMPLVEFLARLNQMHTDYQTLLDAAIEAAKKKAAGNA